MFTRDRPVLSGAFRGADLGRGAFWHHPHAERTGRPNRSNKAKGEKELKALQTGQEERKLSPYATNDCLLDHLGLEKAARITE